MRQISRFLSASAGLSLLVCGCLGSVPAYGKSGTPPTVVLSPAPPSSLDDAGVTRWIKENVQIGDELMTAYGPNVATFLELTGLDRRPDGHLRGWVRYEFFSPISLDNGKRVQSLTSLTEFDCQQQRIQMLATDSYPWNNLQGDRYGDDDQTPQWQYPRPTTLAAFNLQTVCGWLAKADTDTASGDQATKNTEATWTVQPR